MVFFSDWAGFDWSFGLVLIGHWVLLFWSLGLFCLVIGLLLIGHLVLLISCWAGFDWLLGWSLDDSDCPLCDLVGY